MTKSHALIDDFAYHRRTLNTAIAVLAAALAPSLTERLSAPAINGELRIVGSQSMREPVEAWMTIFHRKFPNVRAHAALYGTGLAAGAIADDLANVAPLSRPLVSSERAILEAGQPPAAIRVGAQRATGDASSPLYLYVARGHNGLAQPAAIEFARIAVSTEGQSRIAARGFQTLSGDQRDDALSELDRLAKQGGD